MNYKLGSLFDGSGGFPLAGALCGIEPSWASEVEPYPIAVTRERFPKMKHLGDISKINGAEVEPVDVITFGSPCQDLSVAGKRAGLKHEANGDEETTRSGLFMEAVSIIKEMMRATNGKYPSFALWENVPGAFSSNKGEDFRVVCEELIKIVEPAASMPSVPKNGWPYSDSYVGDGWSLSYRVFDAQYWGVPQRRRRIHLILDLRGERAREVLFEREGVRGYFTQGGKAWERITANAEGSAGTNDREGETADSIALAPVASTLRAGAGAPKHEQDFVGRLVLEDKTPVYSIENHPADSRVNIDDSGKVQTLASRMGTGGGNVPMVMEPKPTYCLQGSMIGRADKNGPQGDGVNEGVAFTCNTIDRHAVAYRQGGFADYVEGEVGTLRAAGGDFGGDSENLICERQPQYIVRRLTPTECARLQGFADSWGYIAPKEDFTDEEYRFWLDVRNTHAAINDKPVKDYTVKQMLTWYNKLYTDSAEYKMWGNGIALPPALYCMQGITEALGVEIPQAEPIDAEQTRRQEAEYINAFACNQRDETRLLGEKATALQAQPGMKQQTFLILKTEAAAGMSGNNQPVICYRPEETYADRLVLDDQGGQQITVREDGNVPCVLITVDNDEKEDELTDLSDAPEEIKEEIMENAVKLENMATEETQAETTNEAPATAFNAIEQLRALAEERKVLAHINTNTPRFEADVRAIEYAVSVLEAVGL